MSNIIPFPTLPTPVDARQASECLGYLDFVKDRLCAEYDDAEVQDIIEYGIWSIQEQLRDAVG